MSEQEFCECECEECENHVCKTCGFNWNSDPFYWVESREGYNVTMLRDALDKESPEFRQKVAALVRGKFGCKFLRPSPVYFKLLELMQL